jgi:uncharacterized YigZ family protein
VPKLKIKTNFVRMETMDTYLSVKGESRGTFREKASRFIAVATPVSSEAEAKGRLESIRKSYHDANHHCFAYRLGPEGNVYRINDDGEPSGTAGRPIYGQIQSRGLSDLLVVVTRYFGGTKLGVPGLINAYRSAAEEALSKAVVVNKVLTDTMEASFDYPKMNDVMKILKEPGITILHQESEQTCTVRFTVRRSRSDDVRHRLSKATNISISINV